MIRTISEWDVVSPGRVRIYRQVPGETKTCVGDLALVGNLVIAVPQKPGRATSTISIDDLGGFPRLRFIGADPSENFSADIDLVAAITRGLVDLGENQIDLFDFRALIEEGPKRRKRIKEGAVQ